MTEHDWLISMMPQPMLMWLRQNGKASERQARLFACACVRRIWPFVEGLGPGVARAIDTAERFADGEADEQQLRAAGAAVEEAAGGDPPFEAAIESVLSLCMAGSPDDRLPPGHRVASTASEEAVEAVIDRLEDPGSSAYARERSARMAEETAQCHLLRDIFANPFRPPPALDPAWLGWNDGAVRRLAEAAYQHRLLPSGEFDPVRLGVLADALEEAGADAALIEHLRGPGPHVRGCHVVDLLTGKE
jgi:hypothetical protein